MSETEYVDVLIVGAGLSGIGAAVHLTRESPSRTYAIVESRAVSGGTWDLFRYPNVRSDSDMYTLGYEFSPWLAKKSIADGPDILAYIRETATNFGVESKIRYQRRVTAASWSSDDARWHVTIRNEASGAIEELSCSFLWGNTGYYRYDEGYRPTFPGEEAFTGTWVHPQFWPEDLDVSNRRVVVIGSGATAMTLVPALAARATHVTLLQRTPTYVAARPDVDRFANWLQRRLPRGLAFKLIRAKNVVGSTLIYQLSRRQPDKVKAKLADGAKELLPAGYDVERHFSPEYNPWDQRLCLVPNGDLFQAIASGKVEMVTDTIDHVTNNGIVTTSGRLLEADVIVTATGLSLQLLGGMSLRVDGRDVNLADCVSYKGIMLSGVPNLALTFGYTNASWTLKADLTARYVCRLLNRMERKGYRIATPKAPTGERSSDPYINLSSGYIKRAEHLLPKQGLRSPWRAHQNYFLDTALFRWTSVEDEMELTPKR